MAMPKYAPQKNFGSPHVSEHPHARTHISEKLLCYLFEVSSCPAGNDRPRPWAYRPLMESAGCIRVVQKQSALCNLATVTALSARPRPPSLSWSLLTGGSPRTTVLLK